MQLKDVMTRDVECVTPETTLAAAARRMRDLDVGPLPVCDHDKLAGMVTDRDIIVRGVAENCDVQTTKVSEVMSKGIDFCFEDDALEDAERIMQERQIRRLLVLNRDKRLVGIVSLADLATRTSREQQLGETVECISQDRPKR